MDAILKLAMQIVEQAAVFGPVVMLATELLKPFVKGKTARRLMSAALSVGLPIAYQCSQGGVDWRTAPFVWLLAFAIAFAGHKLRNANEVRTSDCEVP